MFKTNKYYYIYYQLVNRGLGRVIEGYSEKHHIVPRSLGGADTPDNIVSLTAREHLIAHKLLTKITTGRSYRKMIYALFAMALLHNDKIHCRERLASRQYGMLRQQYAESMSIDMTGSGNPFYGRTHSVETKKKISQARQLVQCSAVTRRKMSETRKKNPLVGDKNGMFGKKHSTETRLRISASVTGEKNGFYGKQHSDAQRERKRQEKLSAEKKVCPHCGKLSDHMNYARWHGDKCKMKGH